MNTEARRLIAVFALSAGILTLLTACGGHETPHGESTPTTVQANLAQAQRIEIPNNLVLSGTVEAEKTTVVSARVMAMVTAVHAQTGDTVKKGALLLEIDPQASRGQLSQTQGALAQAGAALALAERNYERFQALAQKDAASELELDMAKMRYDQAKGAVKQAEGAVASASSVADDSRVVAPYAGRIVQRMVQVGDLAAPGRPLLMMESQGARRLVLTVPASLMIRSSLETGDSLNATIDARPDLGALAGTVAEMSPGADPASHSFRVKVALPADDIPSGASGRAEITLEGREAVVVPSDAVLRQGGMYLVVIRTEEGRAATRVVTVGHELPNHQIEILSGLSGGETVLTGLASVPPAGAMVKAEAS